MLALQATAVAYVGSSSGLVDAIGALAVPLALICGVEPGTAWLLGVLWVLKVVPGIPGLAAIAPGAGASNPARC